ncbi:MAG: 4Fe-4S dicluster domain-containing protein [Deltaproteobacteria bacterium]|nr:4Fe-4S dicluster domain-containing protein [Deltaproteobacteria bacterium]MBW2076412.1 4Fe-4S dicluster domain-containing protein [Deltaproteobacteria bacterium]
MMLTISLYISLAIFIIGLLYKISRWLSLKTTVQSMDIPASKRASSALKGVALAIFSGRILRLIKAFFLDVILQRKVLREDLFRWITHMLIYGAFMLLVLMHALENVITAAIFDTYASTVNPFLFLRDLFGLLVIVGVCMAVYRRYILKSPRLTTNPMDIYTIVLIAFIMVSGILLEATKIGSYSRYKDMVEEWAGLEEEEEEFKALTAFWVQEYATVAPDIEGPFEPEVLELGKEVHEMSCAACHSKPQWAFTSFPVAKAVKGIALDLDRAGVHTLLWYLHFLACFIGLAYLPFSKFFHIITSPLSLLVNSVMNGEKSDPANIATKQALEFDACMHCGNCTNRCSLGVLFERMGNVNILPSEKMQSLPRVISGRQTDEGELQLILDGTYLCTNCHRCTDVCPAGINLEELWFAMRENLFQRGHPEFSLLSPLSFYRGLMRDHIPPEQYKGPLVLARDRIAADCELLKDQSKPVDLSLQEGELKGELLLSDQASTFSACFGCQTCTNVCPVVANYENPKEALGMLPHQIMYALGLSIKDLAFGSNMLWDCVTCYQCQEQCPQGVKVTEVLYELKNLAIQSVAEKVG